jgi:hypothetical protein
VKGSERAAVVERELESAIDGALSRQMRGQRHHEEGYRNHQKGLAVLCTVYQVLPSFRRARD